VFSERFAGLGGGGVQWTNYLIAGGRLVGVHIQKADETTATRYFHTDHLGSISVITKEAGEGNIVVERLSYDAWGKRRHPDGTPDPAGAITSEASRGFTGHEQLDAVGLIHMNGRVYDPLLGRFGTPDPMTENPFSTQGWNRYSYVGNSPTNFADPSGYCFLGCFWKPIFKAIGNFFKENWGAILQIAAAFVCQPGQSRPCAESWRHRVLHGRRHGGHRQHHRAHPGLLVLGPPSEHCRPCPRRLPISSNGRRQVRSRSIGWSRWLVCGANPPRHFSPSEDQPQPSVRRHGRVRDHRRSCQRCRRR
jgi:RHS repeat-associated protein